MRVPTYAHYMNLSSAIQQNKSHVDKYSYQSVSGLKYQNYSGYGMKAYNIVSMESMLKINNTFQENNKIADISIKTANLALETITGALVDVRASLNDFVSSGLSDISPDYTGGEITFTSDDVSKYLGKTLTVNGKTYTLTNNDSDTDIKIDNLSSKEEVMQAIVDKVNDSSVVYKNGKITFPLYTINGTSTLLTEEPAKSFVKTGDVYTMNNEQALALENLQKLAFSTMQMVADTLNTNVAGKYIFGGGSTTMPINFNYSSVYEFQKYYDGINTVYPSGTSSVLSNFAIDSSNTGAIELSYDKSAGQGTIKALGGSFLKPAITMNASNVGNVTFDSASNTMYATEYGAYASLGVGDTIVINGNNGALGDNAKMYVVKSVSADGRTVTFDDETPIETTVTVTPNNDMTINKTFPLGSVINLDGFNDNNLAPTATVIGISDDGKELYVNVDSNRFPEQATVITGGRWSLAAETYYHGGSLEYNQRISESQTINFDVKASDPAFEKIFRALGMVTQGNLVDTSNPMAGENFNPNKTKALVQEALSLLGSAISDAGDIAKEKNSSLYSITAKLSSDYTILNKVIENQKIAAANLENNIGNIKNANKEEAAVKLLLAENALEASYSILSSISKLSLVNYIK